MVAPALVAQAIRMAAPIVTKAAISAAAESFGDRVGSDAGNAAGGIVTESLFSGRRQVDPGDGMRSSRDLGSSAQQVTVYQPPQQVSPQRQQLLQRQNLTSVEDYF